MNQLAALIVAGGFLWLAFISLALYVLTVIACWMIYKKAGEPGWKSLIPIYNVYILFKISWKASFFWVMIGLFVLGGLIMYMDPGVTTYYSTAQANIAVNDHSTVYYLGSLVSFAGYLMSVVCIYQVGRSFGHGIPFFILSLILPNVALLYLGFSSDTYQGNTAARSKEN